MIVRRSIPRRMALAGLLLSAVWAAGCSASRWSTPEALDLLKAGGEDPAQLAEAIAVNVADDPEENWPAVRKAVENAASPEHHARLCTVLGALGDAPKIPENVRREAWSLLCSRGMGAGAEPVRTVSAQGLGQFRPADLGEDNLARGLSLLADRLTMWGETEAVKVAACRSLASLDSAGKERVAVVDATKDISPEVRKEAARAIAGLGLVHGFQRLLDMLADPDEGVRDVALDSVRTMAGRFLKEPRHAGRVAFLLVRSLDGSDDFKHPAARPLLLPLLEDGLGVTVLRGPPELAATAAQPLMALVEQYRSMPDHATGFEAQVMEAFGRLIARSARTLSPSGMNADARGALARAVSASGPEKWKARPPGDKRLMEMVDGFLREAASDLSPEVRLAALEAYHVEREGRMVATLFDDPDEKIRRRAQESLSAMAVERGAEPSTLPATKQEWTEYFRGG